MTIKGEVCPICGFDQFSIKNRKRTCIICNYQWLPKPRVRKCKYNQEFNTCIIENKSNFACYQCNNFIIGKIS